MPQLANAAKTCKCGCGAPVRHWFVMGHDMKLWAKCLRESGGDYVRAAACYEAVIRGDN
jgi:hypothetical protein